MKKYCHWSILGMAFIALLVLTTACGVSGLQAAGPTPTPTPQPPLTLLKNSQKKMTALRSLALNGTNTIKSSSTSLGDVDIQMTLSGQVSQSPVSSSLKIGETMTSQGTSLSFSMATIEVNQQGYIQNTKNNGPWYTLSDQLGQSLLGGNIGNLGTINSSYLSALTAADVTDHGLETVNGKKLRHLTVNTTAALKKAFLQATGNFSNLTQAQLDSINLQTSTSDYWIDEATLYTYQQVEHYIAQYHMDSTGTITSDTPNYTLDATTKLMYNSFNVPVSIKAPANAQPLQNIQDLVS